MEIRTRTPTQEQSAIVERVARIVSRVRGAKPDYARLAAELEPAIPFDVFGIVLLRHDKAAVRVVVCTHEPDGWIAGQRQTYELFDKRIVESRPILCLTQTDAVRRCQNKLLLPSRDFASLKPA